MVCILHCPLALPNTVFPELFPVAGGGALRVAAARGVGNRRLDGPKGPAASLPIQSKRSKKEKKNAQ